MIIDQDLNERVLNMEMHESIFFPQSNNAGALTILRVPGGWIYQFKHITLKQLNSVFVPFNNEFHGENS